MASSKDRLPMGTRWHGRCCGSSQQQAGAPTVPTGACWLCAACHTLPQRSHRATHTPAPPRPLHNPRLLTLPCVSLPVHSSMSALTALAHLDLAHNSLHALPALLGSCAALTHLDASDNKLHQTSALPEALGACRKLRTLLLARNRLQVGCWRMDGRRGGREGGGVAGGAGKVNTAHM